MLLYPVEPFADRVPDEAYAAEVHTAETTGLPHALIDIESLLEGKLKRALRWVPLADRPQTAVYRGWMLRPEVYESLYRELAERGWALINTPAQYLHTHHLPQSFSVLAEDSPRTVWVPAATVDDVDWERVQSALQHFGTGPVIVKDYVKSRKHEWTEACFIPDASMWSRQKWWSGRF